MNNDDNSYLDSDVILDKSIKLVACSKLIAARTHGHSKGEIFTINSSDNIACIQI